MCRQNPFEWVVNYVEASDNLLAVIYLAGEGLVRRLFQPK
jgi:hypothetical protein